MGKYEEALERAKAGKPLDEVFPELKDSEDERIRKSIVSIINQYARMCEKEGDPCEASLINDSLAYLEKQKDASKAIEAVERIDKYIDAHTANAHDMDDSNPDKKYYQGCDDALGKIAGILQDVYSEGSQKEQHPAEVNVKALLTADRLASAEMTGRLKERKDILENPEKYGLYKPAEWSDEDEFFRQQLIVYCENCVQDSLAAKCVDWLNSLRLQPKQKWSQEDNDFADDAIACVTRCYEKYIDNKEFYQSLRHNTMDIKRWLIKVKKRLTPHWKPSKEQMDCLVVAASGYGNSEVSDVLSSLINDLQKLL